MGKNKIIKDLVHNYIEIDKDIQKLIDTPSFQRLKKIKQLTANTLFPSATHTRFDHSLGVMKLAGDFFDSLSESLKEEQQKYDTAEEMKDLNYSKKHLIIAALLHDIGHAPFSHLGESFYKEEDIQNNLKVQCTKNSLNYKGIFEGYTKAAPHELMSCYCILDKMKEILEEIGGIDLEFICRIIIGHRYPAEEWIKNIMIEIVNSSTIDVDKLDYLLRDNHMCGYPATKVDIHRLLKSLYVEEKKIKFYANGVPAIQSLIDSRDGLYLWVYNHHLAVYTDHIISDLIRHMEKIGLLKWENYFSCNAISNGLISDCDLEALFNKKYREQLAGENKEKYQYLNNVLPQLFNRKYLKATWKTIYEYVNFQDSVKNDEIIAKIKKEFIGKGDIFYKKRADIVRKIRKELGLNCAELFFVIRSNKFYHSGEQSNFYVTIGENTKSLSNLLPQKDYKRFDNISFYLFGPENKLEDIKRVFIEKMMEEIN